MSISATGSTSSAATARAAARMRGGWRSAGPRMRPASRRRDERSGSSRSVGAILLALAYPDRIAKNRGGERRVPAGQWPRRATSIRRRRWRASRFSPSPNLPAPPRRAASCSRRRSRWPRSSSALPTSIEAPRGRSPSMPRRQPARPAQRAPRRDRRWPSRPMPVAPDRRTPRACWREGIVAARHRPAALEQSRCSNGATA